MAMCTSQLLISVIYISLLYRQVNKQLNGKLEYFSKKISIISKKILSNLE